MEAIPRISRAQAMDALSSAGERRRLRGRPDRRARAATRFFPMLTTAAGTIPPAHVLVLGVGVAGLQALATARRLGARTTGYDVRPEVAEQVRVARRAVPRPRHRGGRRGRLRPRADRGGARRSSSRRSTDAIKSFDVVITTALVPGPPGAEAGHRRGGRGHEARQRHRRPRRRDRRQLRADRARPDRRQARRHDLLAAEPAGRPCPSTPASSTRATSRRCSA